MSWPRVWGKDAVRYVCIQRYTGVQAWNGRDDLGTLTGQVPPTPVGHPGSHAAACRAPWQRGIQRHQTGPAEEVSRHCGQGGSSQPNPRLAAVLFLASLGPCFPSPRRQAVLWTEQGSHHLTPSPGCQPLPSAEELHMVAPVHCY